MSLLLPHCLSLSPWHTGVQCPFHSGFKVVYMEHEDCCEIHWIAMWEFFAVRYGWCTASGTRHQGQTRWIYNFFHGTDMHSIDMPVLWHKIQCTTCDIHTAPHIHLITSIDSIHVPLLWSAAEVTTCKHMHMHRWGDGGTWTFLVCTGMHGCSMTWPCSFHMTRRLQLEHSGFPWCVYKPPVWNEVMGLL